MRPSRSSPSVTDPPDETTSHEKRNKWARLLLRELYDLGLRDTAAALEREASVQLRSQGMEKLHQLVASGQWDAALQFVTTSQAIHMKSKVATREAALLLLQRKFIDLLLQNQVAQALKTFQDEIVATYALNETEVKQLALLLLCKDAKEMQARAVRPWQDDELQGKFEELVSAEEMVPHGALCKFVKEGDVPVALPLLTGKVTGACLQTLLNHKDDVWELAFAPDGHGLASASKDGSIVLYELQWLETIRDACPSLQAPIKVVHVLPSGDGPVDCLAWSFDSQYLLSSGSHSSTIQLWNRTTGQCDQQFTHPNGRVARLQWFPWTDHFVSGSVDQSLVLWKARDPSIVYQWSGRRVVDFVLHPQETHAFVLVSDHEVRVYDMDRKTDKVFLESEHSMSCLAISPCGKFLLVNWIKHEQVACVLIATGRIAATFKGIRAQRYILRPCFLGTQSELVASGSEDGKVVVWQRKRGRVAVALDGHASVVNVVVRHPIYGNVLASASDDRTVRVWSLASRE